MNLNCKQKKDTADYSKAYRILTNQVKLNPKNAEYRYFLGYAIDRLNADDGKGMLQLKKEMTIKASELFEVVNMLAPVYKGELFILDPYTKLTSILGSLAKAYLNRKLTDSAKWTFSEVAAGIYNTEQVFKLAKKKGFSGTKGLFWFAIRNPVYCGKIFIPKYKEEGSCLVKGVHEPIISEVLYYEVQDVLDGRKRN